MCIPVRFGLTKKLASGTSGYPFVPGGWAAGNRGADYVKLLAPALAPEQGVRPDTVNRTIKLRLLAWPPVPVSTAIMEDAAPLTASGSAVIIREPQEVALL